MDPKYAWRIKTLNTLGKMNLGTRVKDSRKGYDRRRENRSWKKEMA
jgi:hypothetical protein